MKNVKEFIEVLIFQRMIVTVVKRERNEANSMIIILAGMMGTGKSTYTKWLSEHYGLTPKFETVIDNPYLEKFYQAPKRYAKPLQSFFLNDRIQAMSEALDENNTILDRSLFENEIFNRVYYDMGYLDEEDFHHCQQDLHHACDKLLSHHRQQTLMIYLDGTFETVLARIQQRNTSYEQLEEDSHHLAYYKALHETYQTWYRQYDFSPKIAIDIQKFDVVNRPEEVITHIKETLGQTLKGETQWLQQL